MNQVTDYSEYFQVEQPAISLFSELSLQTANFFHEKFGMHEVAFLVCFRAALVHMKSDLPSEVFELEKTKSKWSVKK